MGDLVAAVDAAAHAASAYRRQNLTGSAYGCSARALQLAQQCGGAWTPALRSGSAAVAADLSRTRDPMLVGRGLSTHNRRAAFDLRSHHRRASTMRW